MKIIIASLLLFLSMASSAVHLSSGKGPTFCVAKTSASNEELINNINFVCGTLKQIDCKQIIGEGGSCFQPNTLINHASIMMHLYYVEYGRHSWNCNFKGTGLVTLTDPSYSSCNYP